MQRQQWLGLSVPCLIGVPEWRREKEKVRERGREGREGRREFEKANKTKSGPHVIYLAVHLRETGRMCTQGCVCVTSCFIVGYERSCTFSLHNLGSYEKWTPQSLLNTNTQTHTHIHTRTLMPPNGILERQLTLFLVWLEILPIKIIFTPYPPRGHETRMPNLSIPYLNTNVPSTSAFLSTHTHILCTNTDAHVSHKTHAHTYTHTHAQKHVVKKHQKRVFEQWQAMIRERKKLYTTYCKDGKWIHYDYIVHSKTCFTQYMEHTEFCKDQQFVTRWTDLLKSVAASHQPAPLCDTNIHICTHTLAHTHECTHTHTLSELNPNSIEQNKKLPWVEYYEKQTFSKL